MFEPQDHPDDIPYPGGPPTRPYDNAGWTLAYQMGVKFDRVLEGFDGPFEKVSGLQKPAPGKVTGTAAAGYLLSHAANDSFTAINRLLAAGEEVAWLDLGAVRRCVLHHRQRHHPFGGRQARCRSRAALRSGGGASGAGTRCRCGRSGSRWRINTAARCPPAGPAGFSSSIEFPFEVVYPRAFDANLSSKYDVIIFPSGSDRRRRRRRPRLRRRWGRGRRRPRRRQPSEHPRGIPADARRLYGGRDRSAASGSSSRLAARCWRSAARR